MYKKFEKDIIELLEDFNEIEVLAEKFLKKAKIEKLLTRTNRWYPISDEKDRKLQKEIVEKYEEWFSMVILLIKKFFPERKSKFYECYQIITSHLMLKSKPETLDINEPIQDLLMNLIKQKGQLKSIKQIVETRNIFLEDFKFDPIYILGQIFSNFHKVARQLRSRRKDNKIPRPTLEIHDEYDVQDLLHAILKIFFNDIRPEEWTPSYAGGAVRMDFLLKKEQIVIEIKKSREKMTKKELGEQLIIDIRKYQIHPDCKKLICFVYDPEGFIGNPKGIENDLSTSQDNFEVIVYIRPDF